MNKRLGKLFAGGIWGLVTFLSMSGHVLADLPPYPSPSPVEIPLSSWVVLACGAVACLIAVVALIILIVVLVKNRKPRKESKDGGN